MSITPQKTKNLLLLLTVVALVVFSGWVSLQHKSTFSQLPANPTATPVRFNLNIPQKALWRNYLVVSAETVDEANCRLTYIPPSGNKKVMDVTADSDGLCKWQWKIEETDGKGPGRLVFTINGVSETHFIEIRSSF
jgi:hypothetical protein